ncbi:MAG TPA: ribonuclease H-like domain-containing protein [Spirochaetia bacterium]|nr:ribonuclease H-like domain-containing protein [Spirochaetia bacterium]
MAGDLGERLERLKEARRKTGQETALSGSSPSKLGCRTGDPLIPGFTRIGSYTYKRDVSFQPILPPSYERSYLASCKALGTDRLVFFDLETTGLSGGAGTFVFLAGFGRMKDRCFSVSQYFLSDYPGEREFLAFLRDELKETASFGSSEASVPDEREISGILVSYNGKSFDIPVLRNRFLMSGSNLILPHHIDLLYPIRFLFRGTYPELSLGAVERCILKMERGGDLPGALVPGRYFSFLKGRDPAFLEEVFSHHIQDILSLCRIYAYLESVLADPESHPEVPRFPLGRLLYRHNRELGLSLIREAMDRGDTRAGLFVGRLYKKAEEWEEAFTIWKCLYTERRSFLALVEMLKYLEHRLHDYRAALSLIEEGYTRLLPFEVEKREELNKRKERIERKIKNMGL